MFIPMASSRVNTKAWQAKGDSVYIRRLGAWERRASIDLGRKERWDGTMKRN